MPTSTSLEQVQALYVAYYGRPAEPGGRDYWATRLDANGGNLNAMIDAFGQSQEYVSRFGDMGDAQRIETLYEQLFGRAADEAGRDYYVGVLARGEKSLAEIALTVANAAQGEDRDVLAARVEAADAFTATLSTPEAVEAYSTAPGLAAAQATLARITAESLTPSQAGDSGSADGNGELPAFPETSGQDVTFDAGGWLRLGNGADISEMPLTGARHLDIADAASVAMTPSQLALFDSLNAGRAGTPGHETIFFTAGGTVDLTDADVSYDYVEEYRLSDAGNTVLTGADGYYWIVGGAGDDSVTAGAGNDIFTYAVGSGGADTLVGFELSNGGADELNFINVADIDALAASIDSLRFIDNGSLTAGEPGIDLEIAFATGGSLTLTDQYAAGLDVTELGLSANEASVVPAGGSVAVTGVTGSELSALFGDSLSIGY